MFRVKNPTTNPKGAGIYNKDVIKREVAELTIMKMIALEYYDKLYWMNLIESNACTLINRLKIFR